MTLRFEVIISADGKIDFEKNNGTAHWYLQMACQQKIKYGIQKETFIPGTFALPAFGSGT